MSHNETYNFTGNNNFDHHTGMVDNLSHWRGAVVGLDGNQLAGQSSNEDWWHVPPPETSGQIPSYTGGEVFGGQGSWDVPDPLAVPNPSHECAFLNDGQPYSPTCERLSRCSLVHPRAQPVVRREHP